MLFLKIIDDKDQELELIRDRYQSVIPEKFQWRTWAANPEGITGEELLLFIDHPTDGLFAHLKVLKSTVAPQRAGIVREVFEGLNNYMKSGYAMRMRHAHRLRGSARRWQTNDPRCQLRSL